MNNCFTLPTGERVPLENIDYVGPVIYDVYAYRYEIYMKSRASILVSARRGGDGLNFVSDQDVKDSHKELCADLEHFLEENRKLLNK